MASRSLGITIKRHTGQSLYGVEVNIRPCLSFFLLYFRYLPLICTLSSFMLPFIQLYLFRPHLPLCCLLHILVLRPPSSLTSFADSVSWVYISSQLFISLQLPSSLIHPLQSFLFPQSDHLHVFSISLLPLLHCSFPTLEIGFSFLTALCRPCPTPLLPVFAFFSASPAIESDSLQGAERSHPGISLLVTTTTS